MATHNDLGRWGEQEASDYLTQKGYNILFRNWKYGHRDIDIIAQTDNTIAFIEVKTRRNDLFISPKQAVNRRKIQSLSIAANAFIKMNRIDAEIRFDIISIVGTPYTDCSIEHIEGAFLPLL